MNERKVESKKTVEERSIEDATPGEWDHLSPGEALRRLHESMQQLIRALRDTQR